MSCLVLSQPFRTCLSSARTCIVSRLIQCSIALAVTLWLASTARAESLLASALAQISLETTDLAGNSISTIQLGQQFKLAVIVQDVRTPTPANAGVFAAYLNAEYDAGLASISPAATFTYGPFFTPPTSPFGGDLNTAGQILGAGEGTSQFFAPGNSPQLLWTLPATAIAVGLETFTPSFDSLANHDTLVYGHDFALLASEIQFLGTSIAIVPEPSTFAFAAFGFIALAWRLRKRR